MCLARSQRRNDRYVERVRLRYDALASQQFSFRLQDELINRAVEASERNCNRSGSRRQRFSVPIQPCVIFRGSSRFDDTQLECDVVCFEQAAAVRSGFIGTGLLMTMLVTGFGVVASATADQ